MFVTRLAPYSSFDFASIIPVTSGYFKLYIINFLILFVMSLFQDIKTYATGWAVKATSKMSASDVSAVEKAVVVDSKFGKSVCFYLKAGGQAYYPVAQDSQLSVGQTVDLNAVEVLTLEKSGEKDIIRIK